jgi:ferric-dicitrate binding protein FerR (iron transport regulator)
MKDNLNSNENKNYLSDWFSGTLSDEKLMELVSESDFKAYKKLKQTLDSYQVATPVMDSNFQAIYTKISILKKKKKSRTILLYRFSSAAAILFLMIGFYHLFVFSNSISTEIGKMALINLNDNSKVTLNANSNISYPSFFKFNRKLKLDGEAFFEVEKGETFSVQTAQGTVQVLGTKFDVIVSSDYFEVHCYEGKVKVTTHNKSVFLLKGNGIRYFDDSFFEFNDTSEPKPLWINGESTFKNVPLKYVIKAFQNQYKYQMIYPQKFDSVQFTGSFTNNNLDVALKSICIPTQLKYTKTNSSKIVISE